MFSLVPLAKEIVGIGIFIFFGMSIINFFRKNFERSFFSFIGGIVVTVAYFYLLNK